METAIAQEPLINGKPKRSNGKISPKKPPQKSMFIAYVLWLFGGLFGVHHFYLGNDLNAFLWGTTLGGHFGMGWFGDLFEIPEMVRAANEDPAYMERFINMLRTSPKPRFSLSRFVFAILIGQFFAQLFISAIPPDTFGGIDWSYLHWLTPFVGSLGVYMVGNTERMQGVFKHCLIAAYIAYPIRYIIYDQSYWLTITLAVSAIAFERWSIEFERPPRKRRSMKKRLFLLSTGLCIYLSVWVAFVCFNGKITDGDGEEIPIHEAIHNFFASSWWTDFKKTIFDIYEYAQKHGWYEIYKQIIESFDVDGEQKAFKVLGLSPTASQSEITKTWRTLSKENHPDKVKDESKKREAELQFMEIQQAYEVLSKIKSKRRSKNRQFKEDL